jgi:hypothetical protein
MGVRAASDEGHFSGVWCTSWKRRHGDGRGSSQLRYQSYAAGVGYESLMKLTSIVQSMPFGHLGQPECSTVTDTVANELWQSRKQVSVEGGSTRI